MPGVNMYRYLGVLCVLAVASRAANIRHMSVQDKTDDQHVENLKATTFAFNKVFQDHMVLQKAPQRANIFGFSPNVGQKVTLELVTVPATRTSSYETTVQPGQGPAAGIGVWNFVLDPFAAGVTVNIKVDSAGSTLTINDVIFGDVWICSGQSNMQMTVSMILGAADEIANAYKYPNIRLMTIDLIDAPTPQYDLIKLEENWSKPANDTVGHWDWSYFSAVCWLFGKEVHLARNYPIGLISTNWGGTPIKAWSSPEALATCGVTDYFPNAGVLGSYLPKPDFGNRFNAVPENNSVVWNSMIYPILGMTLYGAIWYQGESDAWGVRMPIYNCTFPTMIKDWRKNFNKFSNGQTSASFPFGFVQLAPYLRNGPKEGFSDIRWHQTADRGYVPNPDMPSVFMAVTIDLPDFNSTYDPIHPRHKKEIGTRLRIAAMSVAYQQSGIFQGPLPTGSSLTSAGLLVDYGSVWTIEVRVNDGFEVQCTTAGNWVATTIVAHTPTTVTLKSDVCSAGTKINGLRYAWSQSPCELYQCPVYETSLGLPAPPFVSYADFDSLGNPYFTFDKPTHV
ncbi:sialate O-acetylesterase-like [Biomphalaria glabrata]|uniref:Sialate O-acetylesterase-like n=1 Tax=Biomphalaria glabrata TaxID=6526 RepID=A0A9W3AQM3_BIOGL|nr:sialate O-acetylesterase-like [Biomphalaria glabrata]